MNKPIDVDLVWSRLRYSPKFCPSALRWRWSPEMSNRWNTRWAGKPAGNLNSTNGYFRIAINGFQYLAHRLVWALAHGEDPGGFEIDHIDGNPRNNQIKNLRLATHAQNKANARGTQSNNTSGVRGVVWEKRAGKWRVQVTCNGCGTYHGYFEDLKEAKAAAVAVRKSLFGVYAGEDGPVTRSVAAQYATGRAKRRYPGLV